MIEDSGVDPEVVAVFLDESEDALAQTDAHLKALCGGPGDREILDALFRTVHNVKGNCTLFGLHKVKDLSHAMEELLDAARAGQIVLDADSKSVLMRGTDFLRSTLARARACEPEVPRDQFPQYRELLERLTRLGASATNADLSTLPSKVEELRSSLAAVEGLRPADLGPLLETVDEIAGVLSRAGVSSEPPPFQDAQNALTELRSLLAGSDESPALLESVRQQLAVVIELGPLPVADVARAQLTEFERLVAAAGFDELLRDSLSQRCDEMASALSDYIAAQELADADVGEQVAEGVFVFSEEETPSTVSAPPPEKSSTVAKVSDSGRTMRVAEARIDEFLTYVGELIIVREMFNNLGMQLRETNPPAKILTSFQWTVEAFSTLSHGLQTSIMQLRRVKMGSLFQRVPRLARDIASAQEKEVEVVLVGEAVEVDKGLVESLDAPLTHMIRNAVDHGLETPQEREAAGKPPGGTVRVSAIEDGDDILVRIEDDGRGLDVAALKAKAIEKGLLTPREAAEMDEYEAYQLLFRPGLSTAKEVTSISGRGVGMDVVSTAVMQRGGRVCVCSTPSEGTVFELRVPAAATVQILDGFLVDVAGQPYVLPLRAIRESFRPQNDEVFTVVGRDECVTRRGRTFSLLRLESVFGIREDETAANDGIVVSVDVGASEEVGLLVDKVVGVQQVVVRPVDGMHLDGDVFTGGAILGDGRVAMVVDLQELGAQVA